MSDLESLGGIQQNFLGCATLREDIYARTTVLDFADNPLAVFHNLGRTYMPNVYEKALRNLDEVFQPDSNAHNTKDRQSRRKLNRYRKKHETKYSFHRDVVGSVYVEGRREHLLKDIPVTYPLASPDFLWDMRRILDPKFERLMLAAYSASWRGPVNTLESLWKSKELITVDSILGRLYVDLWVSLLKRAEESVKRLSATGLWTAGIVENEMPEKIFRQWKMTND